MKKKKQPNTSQAILFTGCFFFLGLYISYSQLRPIEIVLKDGDTLVGIGKLKADVVKYKPNRKSKAQFIKFSKIKLAEIYFESEGDKNYAFFMLDYLNKIIAVERLIEGKKASLYFLDKSSRSFIGDSSSFKISTTTYYAKKETIKC
jgi:hypothetical protein